MGKIYSGTEASVREMMLKIDWQEVLSSLFDLDHGWRVEFCVSAEGSLNFFEIQQNSRQPLEPNETSVGSVQCGWDIYHEFDDTKYDEDKEQHYFIENGVRYNDDEWVQFFIENADFGEAQESVVENVVLSWHENLRSYLED